MHIKTIGYNVHLPGLKNLLKTLTKTGICRLGNLNFTILQFYNFNKINNLQKLNL